MNIAEYQEFVRALAAQRGAPTGGQVFGNQVWNADEGKFIDRANPLDPTQSGRWLGEQQTAGQEQFEGGLFGQLTPEKIQQALALLRPIFDMQSSAMNQQMGRDIAGARRGASAYAASRGYDGAAPLMSRAENQVRESYAPRFDAITAGQGESALGLLGNQYQSLVNLYNARTSGLTNLAQLGMQNRQYEDQNSFDFFRDLFPGVLSGGFSLVSGGLAPGGWLRGTPATGGK